MRFKQTFFAMLAVAVLATAPGCASKKAPMSPFQLSPAHQSEQSTMEKAADSAADGVHKFAGWITPKAKVIPAHDATSLSGKQQALGPDIYVSLARVQENHARFDQAADQYKKALEVDAQYLPALLGYARLLDRQSKLAEALVYYQKAVDAHGDSAAAQNDLGLCFARMGRPAEALGPMSRAVSLEPAKNLYRNNVAAALVELQREDEALQHLATVYPPAQAEYNVAFLLFKQGRKDQALVHFENAARLDPSLMQAREWVARLRGGSFAQNSPVRRTSLEQQSVNPQIASSRAAMQLSPATTNHSVAPAPASQAVRPNVAAQASSPYANYGAAPRQEFLEVAALAPSPSRSTSPPPLVTSPLRLPESSPQRSSAEDAPAPR